MRSRNATIHRRISATKGKMEGDQAILERARKAFAIGLSLLEDQKKNGASSAEP